MNSSQSKPPVRHSSFLSSFQSPYSQPIGRSNRFQVPRNSIVDMLAPKTSAANVTTFGTTLPNVTTPTDPLAPEMPDMVSRIVYDLDRMQCSAMHS